MSDLNLPGHRDGVEGDTPPPPADAADVDPDRLDDDRRRTAKGEPSPGPARTPMPPD